MAMVPGYKQVDAFGPEEEYEGGEEVVYVTLDLGAGVDKGLLPRTSEYRMTGLDTSMPLLQLSETLFRGVHDELIGTELLFRDGHDDADPSRRFVVPVGTTEKRIKFEQVELDDTDDGEGGKKGKERDQGKKRTRRGRPGRPRGGPHMGLQKGEVIISLDT